jgi:SRSO17 transposase
MLNEDWSHNAVTWAAAEALVGKIEGWAAWTLDDTSLLKQGRHSVGVANQYAGCVGTLANCQVLVTLGLAQEHLSTPCAAQLFMPEKWAQDTKRRNECHVPSKVQYVPKWQQALRMVDEIEVRDLPRLPVLADSGYGEVSEFRAGLSRRGLQYVVGVPSTTTFVPAGLEFRAPASTVGKNGRPATRWRSEQPFEVKDVGALAHSLPAGSFREVLWRIGSKGEQRGRFAAVRVRPAHGIKGGAVREEDLQPEQWLLMHWPEGEKNPTKAWLSNLPETTALPTLIGYARLRWRIERDFREGKGLLGLDHFEGRSWHGLHHHAALVIVAQMFMALERWPEIVDGIAAARERYEAASAAAFPPCGYRTRAYLNQQTKARRAQQLRDRKEAPGHDRTKRDGSMSDLRA